jgi:hypothetical protein
MDSNPVLCLLSGTPGSSSREPFNSSRPWRALAGAPCASRFVKGIKLPKSEARSSSGPSSWSPRSSGVNAYPASGGYTSDGRFYFKLGLYRDRMPQPMSIYVDEYRKKSL